MIKEAYDSLKENVRERTTNPFLGTLIVVWVIKNWKLVYSLFYFDAKFTLSQRLGYITDYFYHINFYCNLATVVCYTVVALLVTYILLSVSRLIVNFFEKIVTPLIFQITDKSSVVLKVDYLKIADQIKALEQRLEDERLAKVAAQNERDAADKRLLQLSTPQTSPGESSQDIKLFGGVIDHFRIEGLDLDGIMKNVLNKDEIMRGDPRADELLRQDFIEVDTNNRIHGTISYQFTDIGKRFKRYWENLRSNR